nr:unnamed protein product [Callosobruchus analis]
MFVDYIRNVFHPYLIQKVEFPILLFIDGHRTHITYEISEPCRQLGIILICFYPNSTMILQPADVAAFKPIKSGWKKAVLAWRRENLSEPLKKDKFAPILNCAIEGYAKSNTIRNGFKATGLYSFNPDANDFSKYLGRATLKDTENVTEAAEPNDNAKITYKTWKTVLGAETSKLEQGTYHQQVMEGI